MTYGYIYGLRCKVNGKWYIGQTTQSPLTYIRKTYKWEKGGRRVKINSAILKYGFDNFDVCLLDSSDSKILLDDLEIDYIKQYDAIENGYNLSSGGYHRGKMHESSKIVMREKHGGSKNPFYGKKHSNEVKKRIKEGNTGEKNGFYGRGDLLSGKGNPMYGKKHSEETKKLMGDRIRDHHRLKKLKQSEQSLSILENNFVFDKEKS